MMVLYLVVLMAPFTV